MGNNRNRKQKPASPYSNDDDGGNEVNPLVAGTVRNDILPQQLPHHPFILVNHHSQQLIQSFVNEKEQHQSDRIIQSPFRNSSCSSTTPRPPPSTINGNINIQDVYQMCKSNQWIAVLDCIKNNPLLPYINIITNNFRSTTVLHQAISSQGNIKDRTKVIEEILAPSSCHNDDNKDNNSAAQMKNGNGSLPLHAITHRNVKFDSRTKEMLIKKILNAYPKAVNQQGGVGKRTPLHTVFTGLY